MFWGASGGGAGLHPAFIRTFGGAGRLRPPLVGQPSRLPTFQGCQAGRLAYHVARDPFVHRSGTSWPAKAEGGLHPVLSRRLKMARPAGPPSRPRHSRGLGTCATGSMNNPGRSPAIHRRGRPSTSSGQALCYILPVAGRWGWEWWQGGPGLALGRAHRGTWGHFPGTGASVCSLSGPEKKSGPRGPGG